MGRRLGFNLNRNLNLNRNRSGIKIRIRITIMRARGGVPSLVGRASCPSIVRETGGTPVPRPCGQHEDSEWLTGNDGRNDHEDDEQQ